MINDIQNNDQFNEKILKLMCINQAIDKLQREVANLSNTRNSIISIMEEQVESNKLNNLLKQFIGLQEG